MLYEAIRRHVVTLRGSKTGSKTVWLLYVVQAMLFSFGLTLLQVIACEPTTALALATRTSFQRSAHLRPRNHCIRDARHISHTDTHYSLLVLS